MRVSSSMQKMSMTACVCRNLSTMNMQACLCERSLRNGDMVGDSIQPTCCILAGCALGDGFARVLLCDILPSANNTLFAHLPALTETRQFVDVTTMVVANNEDDEVITSCKAVC